ncbi:MAG TPA: Flp pilus assembly complex ATPase component TadA [Clostridiales bacterium]|nr:Flp pilus assembly complex ATPase component TadA [Clostridiales bacterium]
MVSRNKKGLGEILLESGIITKTQLEEALTKQKSTGKKLGELLIEDGIINEQQLIEALEYQLKIPYIDFTTYNIQPEVPRLISESLARRHMLIPVSREGNQLTVAMVDPLNLYAIDDVNIATGLSVKPALALKSHIQNAVDQYYGKESAEKAVEDFTKEIGIEQINEIEEDILNEVNNAPVVRLVDSIIQHAIRTKASDIHIEPFEKNIRIRFRIDGELQEIMTSSKTTHSAIVTRIKIMGRMDIAEKRIPQDGRVEMHLDDRDVDLRISVLPTVYGEKIVIRLLDRSSTILTKSQLGFSEENIKMFDKLIQSPNGIILVTGPTGSGKTTTLYAVLRELNKINRNIITVEDPVEYRLEGINQVQVNVKAGLTFASGLRSILRQDPDIIMIGEIRDSETAEIAVRAAITGHLVLSTMHTNDSASTVSRLVDMGIEPYLVSSSVVGVVAQRLVKKICTNCKTEYKPSHPEMVLLNLRGDEVLYRGEGCSLCGNTGYKGRTAIHEIMLMTRELRELVDHRASIDEIRSCAAKYGTITLRDSCVQLVQKGITTTEEMLKVTYSLE